MHMRPPSTNKAVHAKSAVLDSCRTSSFLRTNVQISRWRGHPPQAHSGEEEPYSSITFTDFESAAK